MKKIKQAFEFVGYIKVLICWSAEQYKYQNNSNLTFFIP